MVVFSSSRQPSPVAGCVRGRPSYTQLGVSKSREEVLSSKLSMEARHRVH